MNSTAHTRKEIEVRSKEKHKRRLPQKSYKEAQTNDQHAKASHPRLRVSSHIRLPPLVLYLSTSGGCGFVRILLSLCLRNHINELGPQAWEWEIIRAFFADWIRGFPRLSLSSGRYLTTGISFG